MINFPSWYYNEFQQIGTDYTSIHEVEKYDARMQNIRNIHREIETIIATTSLSDSDVVLEIGCGTGEFLINVAQKSKLVYGLDISPLMLEYAQHKIKALDLNNIKLFNAGFLTYQHKDDPVDIVVTQLALHHLPDFWKAIALQRIFEWLKPGGYFFLRDVVYPSAVINDFNNYFDNWISSIHSEAQDEITQDIIRHIKDEYSTLDWIMEGLLLKSGFTIKQKINDNYTSVYICVKS